MFSSKQIVNDIKWGIPIKVINKIRMIAWFSVQIVEILWKKLVQLTSNMLPYGIRYKVFVFVSIVSVVNDENVESFL